MNRLACCLGYLKADVLPILPQARDNRYRIETAYLFFQDGILFRALGGQTPEPGREKDGFASLFHLLYTVSHISDKFARERRRKCA